MTGNMMSMSGGLAQPGLLILDLTASALGANELREWLRRDSVTAQIPSLLLAAEAGGGASLLSKVEGLLRRGDSVLVRGELVINSPRREVTVDGGKVELTFTEFEILKFLAANPGMAYTRGQIVKGAKGPSYPVTDRAVDVQVVSLRRKLGHAGRLIETVRGVGYKFRG